MIGNDLSESAYHDLVPLDKRLVDELQIKDGRLGVSLVNAINANPVRHLVHSVIKLLLSLFVLSLEQEIVERGAFAQV